jgi:hypothetical protein
MTNSVMAPANAPASSACNAVGRRDRAQSFSDLVIETDYSCEVRESRPETTVDIQARPGDVGGLRTGKVGHECADLCCSAEAVDGHNP